jgi:ribonuclease E
MGLIIRTAGAARTRQEIKRDFEYLLRLWENVRDLTLQSTAPCLVYEEGNLIKRSIRDLYSKDIDEIQVAGEDAHKEAQDFMRMLSPSQAKSVIKFEAPEPLFARYQIERQLNAMFSPYVTLRSGGYLVINQTEALVSIDVNSGKSTREFSIEETALQTNLEASEEIARQLKLRDLAGLIVIDFIDMEERRNNRKVENRLKDALRHDRARIQVGRISHFGLLEMSRQRLRTGVVEGSTSQCPHCQGTGIVRSTESVALAVIRAIEDQLLRDSRSSITVMTTAEVALYILNNKRPFITEMEHRYGVSITVEASSRMQGANFAIEKSAAAVTASHPHRSAERSTAVNMESGFESEEDVQDTGEREEAETTGREGDGRKPRRRRGRGRGRRDERGDSHEPSRSVMNGEGSHAEAEPGAEHESGADGDEDPSYRDDVPGVGEQPSVSLSADDDRRSRRRRRGRRGGRRGRDRDAAQEQDGGVAAHEDDAPADHVSSDGEAVESTGDSPQYAGSPDDESPQLAPTEASVEPAPREAVKATDGRRRRAPKAEEAPALRAGNGSGDQPASPEASVPLSEPAPRESDRVEVIEDDPSRPTRKGWWQRRFSTD